MAMTCFKGKLVAHRISGEAERMEDPKRHRSGFKIESLVRVLEGEIPYGHVHRADDIMTAIRISEEFQLPLVLDHCTEGYLICQKLPAGIFRWWWAEFDQQGQSGAAKQHFSESGHFGRGW